jgi:hypothetical protein
MTSNSDPPVAADKRHDEITGFSNNPVITSAGPTLTERRDAAEAVAKTRVASWGLPAGSVVRADDDGKSRAHVVQHVMEAGRAEGEMDCTVLTATAYKVADEVMRVDNAPVPEKMDPATAHRLLNAVAGLSERAGLSRGDEELKNTVVNQGANNTATADGDTDKKADADEPSLSDIVKLLAGVSERLDKLESRGRGDNDKGEEEGKAKELAADSAENMTYYNGARMSNAEADLFVAVQMRADKVFSTMGRRCPPPMHGESCVGYRLRLAREMQHEIPKGSYKKIELSAIRDPIALSAIEDVIYKVAADSYKDPSTVPLGILREVSETRGGHTYTRFYGQPRSWLSAFMPPGRVVKRINEHSADGGRRVLYEH